MREIKFRAWDKTSNRMDEVYSLNKGGLCQTRNGRYHLRADECVLMQFTGLHDKNGKEIYEGDILKGDVCGDGDTETMSVDWRKGSFCFGYYTRLDYPSLEIIGNVWENPELLK